MQEAARSLNTALTASRLDHYRANAAIRAIDMLAELCSVNDGIGARRLTDPAMLDECVPAVASPMNLLILSGNYVMESGPAKSTHAAYPKMVLVALTRALATIAARCPDERRQVTMMDQNRLAWIEWARSYMA